MLEKEKIMFLVAGFEDVTAVLMKVHLLRCYEALTICHGVTSQKI